MGFTPSLWWRDGLHPDVVEARRIVVAFQSCGNPFCRWDSQNKLVRFSLNLTSVTIPPSCNCVTWSNSAFSIGAPLPGL